MPRSLLSFLLLLLVAGCDQTTQFVEPMEVVVYLQRDGSEEVVLRQEVSRGSILEAPVSVTIPRTASGFVASARGGGAFVGVVRPERFDVNDRPRGVLVTGGQTSVSRGVGGAFQPILLFSTDSLWTSPSESAEVEVVYGAQERRQVVLREEAVVQGSMVFTAEDLGLTNSPDASVRVRAEVLNTRGIALVPVLVAVNSRDAISPAGEATQVGVLYRDATDGSRYVLPSGFGLLAFSGSQTDEGQTFALVLLRAE